MDSICSLFLDRIQDASRHHENQKRRKPLLHSKYKTFIIIIDRLRRKLIHRRTYERVLRTIPKHHTLFINRYSLYMGSRLYGNTIFQNETYLKQFTQFNIRSIHRGKRIIGISLVSCQPLGSLVEAHGRATFKLKIEN